jgi:hypothetical protein
MVNHEEPTFVSHKPEYGAVLDSYEAKKQRLISHRSKQVVIIVSAIHLSSEKVSGIESTAKTALMSRRW